MRRTALALAAAALAVLPVLPAAAKPSPRPSSIPEYGVRPGDPGSAPNRRTWAVQPSGPNGPGVRPAFTYALKPGQQVLDWVGISNYGRTPITLRTYAMDAFNTADGGFDLLAADKKSTDVGSWVTLKSPSVTIPARSRIDVPFTLRAPKDATPGDHAGGVVAALRTQRLGPDGTPVALDQRVAARIYLRVAGQVRPRLAVTAVSARWDASPLAVGGAAVVTYTVRNEGNVRLTARQDVRVGQLLLGTRRARDLVPLPELLPGNELTRTVRVTGLRPTFRLRATVDLVPVTVTGETVPAVRRSDAFAAVPWLPLGGATGLAGSFAVVLARRRRLAARRGRHRRRTAATPAPA